MGFFRLNNLLHSSKKTPFSHFCINITQELKMYFTYTLFYLSISHWCFVLDHVNQGNNLHTGLTLSRFLLSITNHVIVNTTSLNRSQISRSNKLFSNVVQSSGHTSDSEQIALIYSASMELHDHYFQQHMVSCLFEVCHT